jgi:transcriptional regulator with XRE-family HTH domain
MGRASLQKPARLAEKLSEIRQRLELSQNGLIRFLGFNDELTQAEISAFERGVRIPSLIILLRYARSIGINVEALIDDDLELPKKF